MSEALHTSSREYCRDVIDRFLDRHWLEERTSIATLTQHRFALNNLDSWMQRHRVVSLTAATSRDVRALLNSSHWDAVSCGCESLLSLVAAFFKNLQDTKFRNDDPIVTLIDQEMATAAKHAFSRPARPERRRARMEFSLSPVT